MNHIEATQYIKATLTAFGPDEAISMTKETWAKLHEAMKALAEQPAQQEPTESVLVDGVAYVIPAAVAYELLHLHLQIEASRTEKQEPLTDEQNRELFAAFVKKNLGDIAVMDGGRYISPKINNYWLVWQEARGITKGNT